MARAARYGSLRLSLSKLRPFVCSPENKIQGDQHFGWYLRSNLNSCTKLCQRQYLLRPGNMSYETAIYCICIRYYILILLVQLGLTSHNSCYIVNSISVVQMWPTQRHLPSPSLSLLQHPSASSYF